MKIIGFCIFYAASTVLCRAWQPPHNVRLSRNEAVLRWDTHASHTHTATYTVQYRIGEDGLWTNMSGCVNTLEKQCDFSVMATGLYGATLRVRAEQDNITSPWEPCYQKVKCVHTRSCAPKVDVNASPGYLSVQMDFNRSDHSLQNEYGGHLSYTLLYGREGEEMKVFCVGCGPAVRVEPLPVGERVCVQVQYRLYSKRHGTASDPECRLIPQSERGRELSMVAMLAAVFSVLVGLSVGCYCFISRYHTHIKDFMRPVTLPEHFTEFFPGPFVQQTPANPSPEWQSHDVISGMEEKLGEEEEDGDRTNGSGLDWSHRTNGSGLDWCQTLVDEEERREGEEE
ncbi:interleukin-10 receptor subunit beta-like, partial [Clupea harengus]|uniref:Interleukin-10 receptor subunit beta-like n=1 Tax=Clupea harengus TaxID=7950 RepID=A0A6P8GLF5_CLUHA